jgi:rubrerythrin
MVPVEALRLALSKEIEAIEVYKKLASEHPSNEVLRDIFSFLINEEEKHKKMLEQEIYKMTSG